MPEESKPIAADPAFDLRHLCRYFSELSPEPMLAVEGETCIVRHVNAAFLRLVGAKQSELVGRPFAEAVPEGVANRCMSLLDRVYRTGTPERLAEQEHGDDPHVHWSYTVWAILGIDERPVGVMIQVTDSTEIAHFRKQSAAINEALLLSAVSQHELRESLEDVNTRLKTAIEDKEYFIAVLSHELRTPLAPVLIVASMLAQNERLDADTRAIMQMIHRNVSQEARLIDDLLDMTRMERGNLTLDRRPIDLRDVAARGIELCKADLDTAVLTLDVDIEDAPLVIDADAGRLQQVISNLLRNAIKFTPAGGNIVVRCRREGDSCAIEVTDNGDGIDPEFLPRAFTAFEQGDRTQARKAGLGLGLAICRSIIDLHGGVIVVRSEGKGHGATFKLTLPAMVGVTPVEIKAEPPAPPVPRLIKPLRILLVEDDADTARVMRWLLISDGHAVEWADDVASALELSSTHEFDLILSDLGLPDGTGVDMMNMLRQRGSNLPGIILSGYGQDQDIARSLKAGFAAHLVKPLSSEMLREAIAALAVARS